MWVCKNCIHDNLEKDILCRTCSADREGVVQPAPPLSEESNNQQEPVKPWNIIVTTLGIITAVCLTLINLFFLVLLNAHEYEAPYIEDLNFTSSIMASVISLFFFSGILFAIIKKRFLIIFNVVVVIAIFIKFVNFANVVVQDQGIDKSSKMEKAQSEITSALIEDYKEDGEFDLTFDERKILINKFLSDIDDPVLTKVLNKTLKMLTPAVLDFENSIESVNSERFFDPGYIKRHNDYDWQLSTATEFVRSNNQLMTYMEKLPEVLRVDMKIYDLSPRQQNRLFAAFKKHYDELTVYRFNLYKANAAFGELCYEAITYLQTNDDDWSVTEDNKILFKKESCESEYEQMLNALVAQEEETEKCLQEYMAYLETKYVKEENGTGK